MDIHSRKPIVLLSGLLLLSVVTCLPACTDLTEVPYSEVTENNFNPTGDDIGSLIAPAYTQLRTLWMGWYGNIDLQEESGDALVTPVRPNGWYDGGTYIRMHKHEWTASQGQPSSLWSNCYSGINAANRVIYQLESGDVPLSEDLLPGILAELRAVRAYYYYLLLDNFGNVPISADFTAEEAPEQSSRQEVYDFVVNELTEVIPMLSEEAGESMYGRLNKWAAKTLLAKVYLNAEVYTGTPQYEEVITQTNDVIAAERYELESDYRSNFTRDNQSSIENIWAVPYDAVNAPGSLFHMKTLKPQLQAAYDMQAQPWGGSASAPQFIDTYDESDTRLVDTWIRGPQYDGDEVVIDFVQNVPAIDSTQFYHGYPVGKYEIYSGMTGNSDVDFPIFRYADVLMMKAEALLRTGSAPEAAVLVTQVRERAFAETDPAKASVTAAELQEGSTFNYGWWEDQPGVEPGRVVDAEGGDDIQYGRMLDELGWEFAAEGHRRQDLIRFGVFSEKTWFNNEADGDSHTTLFPIPLSAMQTNAKLEQNPGY